MAYIKKCRPDSSVKQMSSSALIYTRPPDDQMGVLQVPVRLTDCSAGWLLLSRPGTLVSLGRHYRIIELYSGQGAYRD